MEELEAGLEFKDTHQKNKEIVAKLRLDLEKNLEERAEKEKLVLEAEKIIASALPRSRTNTSCSAISSTTPI